MEGLNLLGYNIGVFLKEYYLWFVAALIMLAVLIPLLAVYRREEKRRAERWTREILIYGDEDDESDEIAIEQVENMDSAVNIEDYDADFPQDGFLKEKIKIDSFEGTESQPREIRIEHAHLVIDKVESIEKLEDALFGREKTKPLAEGVKIPEVPEIKVDEPAPAIYTGIFGGLSEENPDIVLEKINLVKMGTAKKFGPGNMNVSRSGRVYSEEELIEQIKA